MADNFFHSSSSSPSPSSNNNYASNPFMQNLPIQHGTSQNHVLNNNAVQNNTTTTATFLNLPPNVFGVQTHESFDPHWYQGSGSGDNTVFSSGLQELESAMGGLSLRYPFRNSTSNGVQFSTAAPAGGGFDSNNSAEGRVNGYDGPLSNGNGYGNNFNIEFLLLHSRTAAAVRARNLRSEVNLYLNQMYNGDSYANQVNALGNYNYYDGSRGTFGSCLRANGSHNSLALEGERRKIVSLAKDHCGCLLLQKEIAEGKEGSIGMILFGVQYHMHELMTDKSGNYLIQKIFESSSFSEEQRNLLVNSTIQDVHQLRNVCKDSHGTRAIQKMIGTLKTQNQIKDVTDAMKQITVQLMKNANGGYVIQQCVKIFPSRYQREILGVVAMHAIEIATDKSGCSIIQKCMKHAEIEALMPLAEAIVRNAALLAEDPYGNYVVKYLIEMEIRRVNIDVNAMIIQVLCGRFVHLARDKHASNVVQHLLKFSKVDEAEKIVKELMYSREFVTVLQDPFGNYVAQSAVEFSQGYCRRNLLRRIQAMSTNLVTHLYGQKVLEYIRKAQKKNRF